jgi:ribosomal protein S27AE
MAENQACESCGGVVMAEHIDQGRAGRWAGQLLCAVCYAEKRAALNSVGQQPAQEAAAAAPSPAPQPADDEDSLPVVPVDDAGGEEEEAGTISLVDTDEAPDTGQSRIHAFSQQRSQISEQRDWKRAPNLSGDGATRVRTFHAKIQVESIEFMDNAINEWLDENPDIEVKFVTSTIGTMSGKHPEPNLILNVWY